MSRRRARGVVLSMSYPFQITFGKARVMKLVGKP